MRRNAHPFFCICIYLVDTNCHSSEEKLSTTRQTIKERKNLDHIQRSTILSVFSIFIFNSYTMSVSLFYDELP